MSAAEPAYDHVSAREGYDRWAEFYDIDDNPLVQLEEPIMRRLLGDVADHATLDLGCGTGRHTQWLAECGARITAVDFSPAMMEKAKAKEWAKRVQFVVHDLTTRLPWPAAAFDRIVCGLVLDHIVNLRDFYGEVRRLLRPGGSAVFSTVHPAMMLRGVQARFIDPATGRETRLVSATNNISGYVMSALAAGLKLDHLSEHAADEALAKQCPRAQKYIGWPMLLMMRFKAP